MTMVRPRLHLICEFGTTLHGIADNAVENQSGELKAITLS
jgi:hypothetical protein